MVDIDYPLPELIPQQPDDVENSIGKLIAENLVEDGATLQMGKVYELYMLLVHQKRR